MPPPEIRQWFVSGEGIDRHVISTEIQRYLGNDATVRPGVGTGDFQGVQGYWIKAYRNLTSAMIADLRSDSARWKKEQRDTGNRGPYEGSLTHQAASANGPARRTGNSPSLDGAYPLPSRDRMPSDRRAPIDAMDVDNPPRTQPDGRFPPNRNYPQDARPTFPSDVRPTFPMDGRPYPQDGPVQDAYGRGQPIPPSYGQDPRYLPNYPPQPSGPGIPGYDRQQPGGYYVPGTAPYDGAPPPSSRSLEPQYQQGPYGQSLPRDQRGGREREPRDPRDSRDSRYVGQADYPDPSYAYPSPAPTNVPSLRDREQVTNQSQTTSMYRTIGTQHDQYGRPLPAPQNPSGYVPQQPRDPREAEYQRERQPEPSYGRERVTPATAERDARRRRYH